MDISLCEMQLMEVPALDSAQEVIEATHKKIVQLSNDGWKIIGHTKDEKKSAIWVKVMAELTKPAETTQDDLGSLSKQFGDARAKYVAACRKQGMSDLEIARDITIEYRDGGQHMRQLRESYNIE